MMSTILKAHFQAVDLQIFRKKSLNKGTKLVHSFHVSNVSEERRPDSSILIHGTVLRETPGAQSTRKNENLYYPIVQVDKNRKIINTICSCKAGNGYCKHAAAICIYVNEENTRSKTDLPMIWNRPPEIQLEKYSKGSTIKSMKKKDDDTEIPLEGWKFSDVKHADKLIEENSALSIIVKAELEWIDSAQEKEKLAFEEEKKIKELINELYKFINTENISTQYHAFDSIVDDKTLRIKIVPMSCPQELSLFYQQNIVVNETSWKKICFESVKQSKTAVWFKQRHTRITTSTKAHRIKTRQENFESLANHLIKNKYNGTLTEAMRYGLTTEPTAKLKFCEITGQEVHDVGLVIHPRQPFLACSPDGIIRTHNGFELLEIKCPYTCRNTKILGVVYGKKFSYVEYLCYNRQEELVLSPNHQYYTQVQLSLYIMNLKICYFFVYSSQDHAIVKVIRDEQFLAMLIPKLESFYFTYFLPKLH